jgi:DNA polymerase-3 subunit delta
MQVDVAQLDRVLQKELPQVFLVAGDEPLQKGEAVDLIRQQARANGFSNRIVLDVDAKFDWSQLLAAYASQSLFAEKNLIELNLPTAKPGKEGSATLVSVIEQLSVDNILIIVAGRVDAAGKKARWFKTVESHGALLHVWPVEGAKLLYWLKQRAQKRKLQIDDEGMKHLLQCVEGNLLSAVQEIEKLYALFGSKLLSIEDVAASISDNSRYDVFKLVESMLVGNSPRFIQILKSLQLEKTPSPVVLWAIARELRILAGLSYEKQNRGQFDKVFKKYRIWDSKKAGYLKALARVKSHTWHGLIRRCANIDLIIKGLQKGNEWDSFERIGMVVCQPDSLRKMA